jgi:hypothetical protein
MFVGNAQAGRDLLENLGLVERRKQPLGSGIAFQIGRGIGDISQLAATQEAAGLTGLPGLVSRIMGAGAYGAAETPQNRMTGAAIGAGTQGGFEGLGSIGNRIASSYFPEGVKKQLLDYLTKTGKEASSLYENVLGKSVPSGLPGVVTEAKNAPIPGDLSYSDEFKNLFSNKNDIAAHNDYLSNPTIGGAHDLQSRIGTKMGNIKSSPFLDQAGRDQLSKLAEARQAVGSDLDSGLNKVGLSDQYQAAKDFYRTQAAPLRPFSSPASSDQMKDILSTISDIRSKQFKEGAQSAYQGLRPEAQDIINAMQRSAMLKNLVDRGLGVATGGAAGGLIGGPVAAALGSLGGYAAGPAESKLLGPVAKGIYRGLSKAVTARASKEGANDSER